jgi:hypothetical protein
MLKRYHVRIRFHHRKLFDDREHFENYEHRQQRYLYLLNQMDFLDLNHRYFLYY